MNKHRIFSVYGEKPTPAVVPFKYVRNNATKQVVRCTAFVPVTRRYNVETVGGETLTLHENQFTTDVTFDEELTFMALNPEWN